MALKKSVISTLLRGVKLTPDQAEIALPWLQAVQRNLPSSGRWVPWRDVSSCDVIDAYLGLLGEMRNSPSRVTELVAERAATGRWPKMPQSDRFWMHARFEWATALCRNELARAGRKFPPMCRLRLPTGVPEAIEWLLQESWEKLGASVVLKEEIDGWCFQEPWTDPEWLCEWGKFLERVKNGEFLFRDPVLPPYSGDFWISSCVDKDLFGTDQES